MTPFDCGCTPDGTDRCTLHGKWCCHAGCEPHSGSHFIPVCPPCRIAKWRSVWLSAEATPTRGRR
jgi:hypothetical protein